MLRLKIGALNFTSALVAFTTGALDFFYMLRVGQVLRLIGDNRNTCASCAPSVHYQPKHLLFFFKKNQRKLYY